MKMLRIGWWLVNRRQEPDLLYQIDSEQEHLIPGQQLAHAVPLPNTEWNYPLILFIAEIQINCIILNNQSNSLPPILSDHSIWVKALWLLEKAGIIHDKGQVCQRKVSNLSGCHSLVEK